MNIDTEVLVVGYGGVGGKEPAATRRGEGGAVHRQVPTHEPGLEGVGCHRGYTAQDNDSCRA